MNVVAYRAAIKALLASEIDGEIWTDTLIDAALLEALGEYQDAAPVKEASVTVATGGREQDLSSITGLYKLGSIAWPWYDEADFGRLVVAWQLLSEDTVRLIDADPQAGDVMRVRYWSLQTIEDLDGETETTVPAGDERLLVKGAAAWACLLRYRQVLELAGAPAGLADKLWQLQARLLGDYRADLAGLGRPMGSPWLAWGCHFA